jgi:hypothetical protein
MRNLKKRAAYETLKKNRFARRMLKNVYFLRFSGRNCQLDHDRPEKREAEMPALDQLLGGWISNEFSNLNRIREAQWIYRRKTLDIELPVLNTLGV